MKRSIHLPGCRRSRAVSRGSTHLPAQASIESVPTCFARERPPVIVMMSAMLRWANKSEAVNLKRVLPDSSRRMLSASIPRTWGGSVQRRILFSYPCREDEFRAREGEKETFLQADEAIYPSRGVHKVESGIKGIYAPSAQASVQFVPTCFARERPPVIATLLTMLRWANKCEAVKFRVALHRTPSSPVLWLHARPETILLTMGLAAVTWERHDRKFPETETQPLSAVVVDIGMNVLANSKEQFWPRYRLTSRLINPAVG
ncbi:hypothetical protein DFH08DRAFT_994839 [Mycena albidolilacea]|uniref:Uncharacterized protein n=1 Tax=Mycena albidolilacea TaxID=1033008 RepID=A0AAD7A660_9AGAR|nr:hypothetical protein DFH08DRAFT_994839 [Mycena albidolilacea]